MIKGEQKIRSPFCLDINYRQHENVVTKMFSVVSGLILHG